MECTIYVAKTKALMSYAVICTFVFTYAKKQVPHNATYIYASFRSDKV